MERFERLERGGVAAFHAEFLKNHAEMLFDGRIAIAEDGGDFGIGFSLGDPQQHLGLAWREAECRAQRLGKPSSTVAVSGNQLEIAPAPGPVHPPVVDLRGGWQIRNLVAVTVAPNATLRLNNNSAIIGSLAGAGNVELGSGALTLGGLNTAPLSQA